MKGYKTISLILLIIISFTTNAQSPGGVEGAELWVKAKHTLNGIVYDDLSINNKELFIHNGTLEESSYNFNPSLILPEDAYISFFSSLEEKSTSSLIFVRKRPQEDYDLHSERAYAYSDWRQELGPFEQEMFFNYSSKNFINDNFELAYNQGITATPINSVIQTLIWRDNNPFNIQMSYGVQDESEIFIGKEFQYDSPVAGKGTAITLNQNIPEILFFDRALSQNEKNRIESYLAAKYGITLTGCDYVNSLNEIFWDKSNNTLFGNNIFGISRDVRSGLYQIESTSSHKSIFLSLSTEAILPDATAIFIGSTAEGFIGTSGGTLPTNVKRVPGTGLVSTFGHAANQINTDLKLPYSYDLSQNEVIWFLIDRTASNTQKSDFLWPDVEYIQMQSTPDGYILENIIWNESENPELEQFDQFTFGKGPKMIILSHLQTMQCEDTEGTVDVAVQGGVPPYQVTFTNRDGIPMAQLLDLLEGEVRTLQLPVDIYDIFAIDNNVIGFTQTIELYVSPIPGVLVDLGEDQTLPESGQSILLDAGEYINVSGVGYNWFKDGVELNEHSQSLSVPEPGLYRVDVTNSFNECIASDEIVISAYSKIINLFAFPNPILAGEEIVIRIDSDVAEQVEIQIHDAFGRIMLKDKFNSFNQYTIEKSRFLPGIYFVNIYSTSVSGRLKLIVQ